MLCIDPNNLVQIIPTGMCPDNTVGAIAGNVTLETQSRDSLPEPDPPYARTIAATNTTGNILWLIVVDGKQPYYSEGLTLTEARDLLQEVGADVALNLDGGGSATLVAGLPSHPHILNAPIHSKWPMRERPVATHLGIYAQPLPDTSKP